MTLAAAEKAIVDLDSCADARRKRRVAPPGP